MKNLFQFIVVENDILHEKFPSLEVFKEIVDWKPFPMQTSSTGLVQVSNDSEKDEPMDLSDSSDSDDSDDDDKSDNDEEDKKSLCDESDPESDDGNDNNSGDQSKNQSPRTIPIVIKETKETPDTTFCPEPGIQL